MRDRAVEIAGFLSQSDWADARQTPFQADFSPRRYARLERNQDPSARAILMDADASQKTPQFVAIAELLRSLDIAAPQIYAANPAQGLVLMEDFGDRAFGSLLDQGDEGRPLYWRAVDVLVHLHKSFDREREGAADLPHFNSDLFVAQAELFLDAYYLYVKGHEISAPAREAFREAWRQALEMVEDLPRTLMLRDFMPDNLMDLSGGKDWRSTGVLDFQDAGLGPIAYDLASLCEVVRRPGGDQWLDLVIDYYYQQSQPSYAKAQLRTACHIFAAQRHMRILGILARLAITQGRREKLAYRPRIWEYLAHLLQEKALRPVLMWVTGYWEQ